MHRRAPWLLLLLCTLLPGCQTDSRGVVDAIKPETVSVGVTAPNALSGPLVVVKGRETNGKSRFGVLGVMVSGTWRLKPIKIDRTDGVRPVSIVPRNAPLGTLPTQTNYGGN